MFAFRFWGRPDCEKIFRNFRFPRRGRGPARVKPAASLRAALARARLSECRGGFVEGSSGSPWTRLSRDPPRGARGRPPFPFLRAAGFWESFPEFHVSPPGTWTGTRKGKFPETPSDRPGEPFKASYSPFKFGAKNIKKQKKSLRAGAKSTSRIRIFTPSRLSEFGIFGADRSRKEIWSGRRRNFPNLTGGAR